MTIEQRLDGICRMIDERRREDDGGEEWTMTWSVQPGLSDHSYAVATIGLRQGQEEIATGDYISLTWRTDGVIEARVVLTELTPGSITGMTVLAAQHPQGDFQVAEALEAIT